jgi:short-subunit dehydrogenase
VSRHESGTECITASVDLAAPDAMDRIIKAVGPREVGLYVGNAGSDTNGSRFLDRGIDVWLDLVRRNVLNTMQACHHFGGSMRERGHGGLLLVNSYACYGGGNFMAAYTASKAFELCFAESLWSELKPHGVDVLTLVLGATDTPALNTLLAEKGMPLPPGTASPDAVATLGLTKLAHGPVQNWGRAEDEAGSAPSSAAARRARVLGVNESSKAVFGES